MLRDNGWGIHAVKQARIQHYSTLISIYNCLRLSSGKKLLSHGQWLRPNMKLSKIIRHRTLEVHRYIYTRIQKVKWQLFSLFVTYRCAICVVPWWVKNVEWSEWNEGTGWQRWVMVRETGTYYNYTELTYSLPFKALIISSDDVIHVTYVEEAMSTRTSSI
jgi:hypothetical protein